MPITAVTTDRPSADPSQGPSQTPSKEPTQETSAAPSQGPSQTPSKEPTQETSAAPSQGPTQCPTEEAYISNYWIPPLDVPGVGCDNKRLKIPDHGEYICMSVGEGICRDNGGYFGEWRFGVEEIDRFTCNFSGICPQPEDIKV